MKTFEERYTAWIDGKLTGDELTAFERELDDASVAESDKAAAHKVGDLLRNYAAPQLTNADFFSNQLMERIERDAKVQNDPAPRGGFDLSRFPWFRFASAGLAAVALGWAIARVTNPFAPDLPHAGSDRPDPVLAQIIEAKPLEPGISASVVQDKEDKVTVLWLDGLEYLPASYELQ